jgi:hypothetical protein
MIALAACAALLFYPCGENAVRAEDRPIRIKHSGSLGEMHARRGDLCVLNGDLTFVAFLVNRERPGGPGDPPLPDLSVVFFRDGQMLRAKIVPTNLLVDRAGKYAKVLLAKDGWYVTADFTTNPPQVILTEKPTEHSRWSFVLTPEDTSYASRWFIKTERAPGEAFWLTMEAEGMAYRGGVARKPILLVEKKDYFWIGDADSGK